MKKKYHERSRARRANIGLRTRNANAVVLLRRSQTADERAQANASQRELNAQKRSVDPVPVLNLARRSRIRRAVLAEMTRAVFNYNSQIDYSMYGYIGMMDAICPHCDAANFPATIRSEQKIALALASSGIAATLLEGGRTAHSALKLPLNVKNYRNHDWLREHAILAPKNIHINAINFQIQAKLPGVVTTYKSIDSVMNQDEAMNYSIEFLNSLEPADNSDGEDELQLDEEDQLFIAQDVENGTDVVEIEDSVQEPTNQTSLPSCSDISETIPIFNWRNNSYAPHTFNERKKTNTEIGLGESVVLCLTEQLKGLGCEVYFDNFFNSPALQHKLMMQNTKACGIVRTNRKNVPKSLPSDKSMKRGDIHAVSTNGITFVKCMDTKAVHMLTNFISLVPTSTVKRRQAGTAQKINVTCPEVVMCYNKYMGGVDLWTSAKHVMSLRKVARKTQSRRSAFEQPRVSPIYILAILEAARFIRPRATARAVVVPALNITAEYFKTDTLDVSYNVFLHVASAYTDYGMYRIIKYCHTSRIFQKFLIYNSTNYGFELWLPCETYTLTLVSRPIGNYTFHPRFGTKLKAALLELKASRQMCDCLVGERDDHETEIKSVIFINTKLKGELAELDIKCNDLSDQRDRLQGLLNETDDCRNQYERSLLQIEALQEELQNSKNRTHKLQHQLDLSRVNETIKLCDSMLDNTTPTDTQKTCLF
ncbi:Chimeric ERCC6-PGBD3 protein [Eumeta japonica]|uniref:ATP-dependent DNA helicase n=1 Tax=Eumeta variegata TaxID=151549 RepID=A0A4C2AAW3_EUMVA|nr:Chimeric ERCC6-PGBD3 protein [Eumeta japonica]